MGAPIKYDWPGLYELWNKTPQATLEQFCLKQGIGYTYASRTFKKFDDEAEARSKRLAAMKLQDALPETADRLLDHIRSDDEGVSLKAVIANLGISGFSPQAASQATQVNLQVNLPSMFSNAENQSELKSLLQGELKQDDPIQ